MDNKQINNIWQEKDDDWFHWYECKTCGFKLGLVCDYPKYKLPSKCPKCQREIKNYDEWLILSDNCYTCKHRDANICNKLEILEKVIDIVFSDDYPEYKEAKLCELLEAYKRDK